MVLAINIPILLGPELGRSKTSHAKLQIGLGGLVEGGQIIRAPVPIGSRVEEFLEMEVLVDVRILLGPELGRIKATYRSLGIGKCSGSTSERGEIRHGAQKILKQLTPGS